MSKPDDGSMRGVDWFVLSLSLLITLWIAPLLYYGWWWWVRWISHSFGLKP